MDTLTVAAQDIHIRKNMVYNIDMDDQSETFQLAIRYNNYKLIWGQTREFKPHTAQEEEVHLFNLAEDPYEERDLAATRRHKLADMKQMALKLAENMRIAFRHHTNIIDGRQWKFPGKLLHSYHYPRLKFDIDGDVC